MPLELRIITSPTEMHEVAGCLLASQDKPPLPDTSLLAPKLGDDQNAEIDRILGFAMRVWFLHCGNPNDHLVKVVDTDANDKVVGVSKWEIVKDTPPQDVEAKPARIFWLPPGPSRRFLQGVTDKMTKAHAQDKPHVTLVQTATHPDARRRGVGRMMMEWGIRQADDLGLPTFVKATPLGAVLYSRYGFRFVGIEPMVPSDLREDNDEWRQLEKAWEGRAAATMRRPIRGLWTAEDGADVIDMPEHDLTTNLWKKAAE